MSVSTGKGSRSQRSTHTIFELIWRNIFTVESERTWQFQTRSDFGCCRPPSTACVMHYGLRLLILPSAAGDKMVTWHTTKRAVIHTARSVLGNCKHRLFESRKTTSIRSWRCLKEPLAAHISLFHQCR